jgi:magnesium transporter
VSSPCAVPNLQPMDDPHAPVERLKGLRAIRWRPTEGEQELHDLASLRSAWADESSRLWLDLVDATPELLGEIGALLGLHPLVVEDIAERNQRAKSELTGDALHVVMFSLAFAGEMVSTELDIVLGERYLLTAHDHGIDLHEPRYVRRGAAHYLSEGPDYLLWAIADRLVDDYFPIFDRLADEIEDLGDQIIARPSSWLVERLFQVRRDLLLIRHAVMPQREIFNQLTNRDIGLIRPQRIVYFRDVYDHLIRLTDELDSHRELVTTTLDIYLSQVNNNLSEIMRRLTAVTVVVAGIGAVAGVFGMSEASGELGRLGLSGFWLVTVVLVLAGAAALLWFRRIRWL